MTAPLQLPEILQNFFSFPLPPPPPSSLLQNDAKEWRRLLATPGAISGEDTALLILWRLSGRARNDDIDMI